MACNAYQKHMLKNNVTWTLSWMVMDDIVMPCDIFKPWKIWKEIEYGCKQELCSLGCFNIQNELTVKLFSLRSSFLSGDSYLIAIFCRFSFWYRRWWQSTSWFPSINNGNSTRRNKVLSTCISGLVETRISPWCSCSIYCEFPSDLERILPTHTHTTNGKKNYNEEDVWIICEAIAVL